MYEAKTVIVAGATKHLQTQYVREARKARGVGTVFAVFGKANYVCAYKVRERLRSSEPFFDAGDYDDGRGRSAREKERDEKKIRDHFGTLLAWCNTLPDLGDARWDVSQAREWEGVARHVGLGKRATERIWSFASLAPEEVCRCRDGMQDDYEALEKCDCPFVRSRLLKRHANLVVCNIPYMCCLAAFNSNEYKRFVESRTVVWDEAHLLAPNATAIYEQVALELFRERTATTLLADLSEQATDASNAEGRFSESAKRLRRELSTFLDPVCDALRTRSSSDENESLLYEERSVCARLQTMDPGQLDMEERFERVGRFLGKLFATLKRMLYDVQQQPSEKVCESMAKEGYDLDRSRLADLHVDESALCKRPRLIDYLEDIVVRAEEKKVYKGKQKSDAPAERRSWERLLEAMIHVVYVSTDKLSYGTLRKVFFRVRNVTRGARNAILASDYEVWKRREESTQAPIFQPKPLGIEFDPSLNEKATALASICCWTSSLRS